MSLFSIRRHQTDNNPTKFPNNDDNDGQIGGDSVEHYCAIKGIAFRVKGSPHKSLSENEVGDIQHHLRVISQAVRPEDAITLVVKLECLLPTRTRYLTVVSTAGADNAEENTLLGFDWNENNEATLGMVVPVYSDTSIILDGDGGFVVSSDNCQHTFKPISVQSMWSALQTLNKTMENARKNNYFAEGASHTWTNHYLKSINSSEQAIIEWNATEMDSESNMNAKVEFEIDQSKIAATRTLIKNNLRDIMAHVDIEEVTSKQIRSLIEDRIEMNLKDFKEYIDECMIVILRQMDSSSEILPYLYLGSEWNAANIEELKNRGIKYILNVSQEIDNFFPNKFSYLKIRVTDEETTDLITNWDKTYKFIKEARNNNSKVLVHCKMGVSRSASTVIAYVMKEYKWPLQTALEHVKSCRSCINPNPGFYTQLVTYEGLIKAGRLRHSHLWRKRSYSDTSIKQLISFRRNQMNKKSPIVEHNEGLKVESDQFQDATSTTANEDSDFSSFYSCVSRLASDHQIKNDGSKEKNSKKLMHGKGRQLNRRMQAARPVKSNPNLCNLTNEFSQVHSQIVSNTFLEVSSSVHREGSDTSSALENNSSNEIAVASDTKSAMSQNIVLRYNKEEDCSGSSKTLNEARGKADTTEVHSNKATKLNKREGSKVKGIKNLLEGISKGWQASKAMLRQNSNKSPGSKYEEQHKFDEGKRSPRTKVNSSVEDQQDSYGDYFDNDTLDQLIASSEIDHKNDLDEENFNISVKDLTLELESAHAQTFNESLFNTPKSSNQKFSPIHVDNDNVIPISETGSKSGVQRNNSHIKNIVEKFESSDCQAN